MLEFFVYIDNNVNFNVDLPLNLYLQYNCLTVNET